MLSEDDPGLLQLAQRSDQRLDKKCAYARISYKRFQRAQVTRLMDGGYEVISGYAGTHQHEPRGSVRLALELYPLKRRGPWYLVTVYENNVRIGASDCDTYSRVSASLSAGLGHLLRSICRISPSNDGRAGQFVAAPMEVHLAQVMFARRHPS